MFKCLILMKFIVIQTPELWMEIMCRMYQTLKLQHRIWCRQVSLVATYYTS